MPLFNSCTSSGPPIPTPNQVDLERFMGPWYIHGYTPILVDKEAHNAVEHYFHDKNGRVEATYQFRHGSFNGALKTHTPVGFPEETTGNVKWKMQLLWPFKADYLIMYVSDNYTRTIVVHPSRRYVWIMTRSPEISETDYQRMIDMLTAAGFDQNVVKRLPHDWTNDQKRLATIKATGTSKPLIQVLG